ncbi:capsular polysaccharide export protein, LipB/KpsS family [Sphingomonas sp. PAMC 26617]|uniref:capsular polysaccharide export protein, LipB/KpsS family n=1 Tax=Sphingomonas sp. PAMC 26617 TaxID=1112216 RepID=UPI001E3EF25F|nr:beta-3-deoxy-D-manno-oct-2-ulosonic acid transferase [Sphingomonas sp. PAMC 26617]
MTSHLPILRAPPFPGGDVSITASGPGTGVTPTPAAVDQLFEAIRGTQVGGCFWGRAMPAPTPRVIHRARTRTEASAALALLPEADRTAAQWIAPSAKAPVDPWSLLPDLTTLVAHGEDEWVALGVIAGVRVHLLTPGRFGAPGDDAATLRETVARDLARTRYRDPFTGGPTDLDATIAVLGDWRRVFAGNHDIVAGCGFSWWKRREIARFLYTPAHPLRFFRAERRALALAARRGGAIAIWPSRVSARLVAQAAERNIPLVRVEDGFVRSVGLGSNLVPPSSVAVDWRGIHYDPTRPSDLEVLLATADFPPALLARAARLRDTILKGGISKYGSDTAHTFPKRETGRRLVLVPGQVEDDMSVKLGGGGLASNLELLRRARALEPDAELWFRPHPDVTAGHRKGAVAEAEALRHADRVVTGGGMAPLLDLVDGVHVLTSLTGFEALLRGRDVTCHGTPFYAGWGVTRDLGSVPDRRGRQLTVLQLLAGVLIQYPRYLDPVTALPCAPEVLIARMGEGAAHNRLGWVTRLRQLQGRLIGARTA